MSFTSERHITFPPPALSLHAYFDALSRLSYFEALWRSFWIALVTAGIATTLGTLAALALVRYRFRGRDLIQGVFMSPLILPHLVIGIALLQYYSLWGFALSAPALIIGHVIITLPYAIRLVGVSLSGLDKALELAAWNLGATPRQAFMKITLPLIRPGIFAGAIFTFITSFDNVTISVFLAGPNMATFPVLVYATLDQPVEPWLVALCSIVMVLTAFLIVFVQRVVGLQGLFHQGGR